MPTRDKEVGGGTTYTKIQHFSHRLGNEEEGNDRQADMDTTGDALRFG